MASPEARISASQALRHPWIRENSETATMSTADLRLSLSNLRNFRTQMIFQKAVLSYIASQQVTTKELEKIQRLFAIFDQNKDGQLTKKELIAGYQTVYRDPKRAKREAEAILRNLDLTGTDVIKYEGMCWIYALAFVMANVKIKTALSEEKLKEAFDFYDEVLIVALPLGQKRPNHLG